MTEAIIEWNDENQKRHNLQIVDKIFVGRECKGINENQRILVDHPAVSREHASISRNGKNLEITDLSVNGTVVNKVRMTPGSRMNLNDGDIIKIGPQIITINIQSFVAESLNIPENADLTMVDATEVIVTCLVADVRNFSAIAEKFQSADTFAIMKEIFGSFSDVVVEYNGTIKDYAGDAIFAYWMHSTELTAKQAVLAVQAAEGQCQKLGQSCSNFSEKNPAFKGLRVGWGLTTGRVTMSHYGARVSDIALVGDCVNLAFRLSGMANKKIPNKIIMCARTAGLVQDSFSLDNLGPKRIKGRKGKENVFGITIR